MSSECLHIRWQSWKPTLSTCDHQILRARLHWKRHQKKKRSVYRLIRKLRFHHKGTNSVRANGPITLITSTGTNRLKKNLSNCAGDFYSRGAPNSGRTMMSFIMRILQQRDLVFFSPDHCSQCVAYYKVQHMTVETAVEVIYQEKKIPLFWHAIMLQHQLRISIY